MGVGLKRNLRLTVTVISLLKVSDGTERVGALRRISFF